MPELCPRLLIVDDEPSLRRLCAAVAQRLGLRTVEAAGIDEALETMERHNCELALLDLDLQPGSGLDLLAELRQRWPRLVAALMTANGSIEVVVEAMRLGACDYLNKPFGMEELQLALERMAAKQRALREAGGARSSTRPSFSPCVDLEELERRAIEQVVAQVAGDKEQACRMLGISRATFYRKIKRYGIQMGTPEGASGKPSRAAAKPVVSLSQS